jgi:pilus assembly protein CpaB
MVMAVALVFAALASGGVAMYLQGVREDARTGGGDVSVLHAVRDIPAGTDAGDVVEDGAVEMRSVAKTDLIQGAVFDADEIEGLRTTSPILAGEQVTMARFEGSSVRLGGGTLGLPPGYQAVGMSLESSRAAGGALQPGDHVTVYATFSTVSRDVAGTVDVTVVLVPNAEVLDVHGAGVGQEASPQAVVTVAVKSAKAQRLVFAQERGKVWLSLLAPNETPPAQGPVSYGEATE